MPYCMQLKLSRAEADRLAQILGHHVLGDCPVVQRLYNRLADAYENRRLPLPEPLPAADLPEHAYGDRQLLVIMGDPS